MFHASETLSLTKPNLQRLQRNDRAMIRQSVNFKQQDIVTIRSSQLLAQFGIEDQHGPGKPNMTWKQLTEGSQRVEALCY